MTPDTTWAIVPALDLVTETLDTCRDLLAQSAPCRVLLISQGSSEDSLHQFRQFAEQHHPRVLLWSFQPALPSLSSVWNRALNFVWEIERLRTTEPSVALVCNNDLRLHPGTLAVLRDQLRTTPGMGPLFVSAVGVRESDWSPDAYTWSDSHGGPDFSCFLITKTGHDRYPFDEGFIPAFMEDCDAHRRYMLGGDADRIYSINLPFLHLSGGSRTINQSPEARERFERAAGIGRAHYQASWGGPPNQERFTRKGDPESAQDGVTNPELQAAGGMVEEPEDCSEEEGDRGER